MFSSTSSRMFLIMQVSLTSSAFKILRFPFFSLHVSMLVPHVRHLDNNARDNSIMCIELSSYRDVLIPLREIANLALWFVPEGAQSAWTLQETHRNSTSYARDEARTSKRLLDRQTP